MLRAIFLAYWIFAITYLFTQLGGQPLWFKVGAVIATFGMIFLLANTFRSFLSPTAIVALSCFGIGWFIYMAVKDARGTFSPIEWLNLFWVMIDLASLVFCLRTFKQTRAGVYIYDALIWVDHAPMLVYKHIKDFLAA